MLIIDAMCIIAGVCALAAGSVLRYTFGAFILITVCGFAFGARAGLQAVQKSATRALVVVLSVVVWLCVAAAAIIWWVNRYGE